MVSKIKQTILAISIAIIFAFFVFYGIWAFYKGPKYENFCTDVYNSAGAESGLSQEALIAQPIPSKTFPQTFENESACTAVGGKWTARNYECPKCDCPQGWWNIDENDDFRTLQACYSGCSCPEGWCDPQYTCRTAFEKANKIYERNVFIAGMILGIAAVIASLLIKLDSVSIGFMAGGILVMIVALIRYWNELGDKLRFVILTIVLIILVVIGYKKLNPKLREKVK